jgi:hypothetical protein
MPTTYESRLIAASPTVILSGDHARSGQHHGREGIWGGATPSASQTHHRQMLTPSAPPSFHPARLSMTL